MLAELAHRPGPPQVLKYFNCSPSTPGLWLESAWQRRFYLEAAACSGSLRPQKEPVMKELHWVCIGWR